MNLLNSNINLGCITNTTTTSLTPEINVNFEQTSHDNLDCILGDDMMHQILTFLDHKFRVHTCMIVSKYWYERVLSIPWSLSIRGHDMATLLSKLQNITYCSQRTFNLTEISIKSPSYVVSATEIIKSITTSPKFRNINSLSLENFVFGKEDISEITSGYFKTLTKLSLYHPYHMLDTNYGAGVIVNSELCDAHKKFDVDSADIIANSVHMKELRRLRLTTKFGDDLIRALCDSEYIKKLDSIILQSCNLSKNGIIMLSNCASMNNLTELEVLYTFGEEGLAAIANSTVLRNLRVLNLSAKIFQHWNANACRIGKTGANLLSKSSYLTNITKLDLENNNIEDEGVLSICESEFSRNITHLNLASNGITENGISFLTKLTSKMVHLITLHLDLNYITLHGAKMIASSRVMQHLKAISFLKCYIGDEGIVDICNSEFLKNLTSLIVDCDTISEKGARILSMASILKLKSLSLPSCNIENNGLIVMANSSALCQLTHLDVGFNDISSEGIQAICNSPYWKNLSFLSLRNISLSDDDVDLIGRTLHNLHELHTSISTSQLESLSKLLPYCEINNWVTLLDVD